MPFNTRGCFKGKRADYMKSLKHSLRNYILLTYNMSDSCTVYILLCASRIAPTRKFWQFFYNCALLQQLYQLCNSCLLVLFECMF